MSTAGDIAVLQFGGDSKWHWIFLTPSVPSTLSFDASTTAALAAALTWSTLPGAPAIGTQMSADSGWTAVTATPDKTVTLANYTNTLSGAAVTALDALVGASGSGTAINAGLAQVVILTKQVAALRALLLAAKLPNA